MPSISRILVDHAGQKGIGDIVCETGFYQALKREHPDAEVHSRASRSLAWGNPFIDGFDERSPDEAFDRVLRPGHAVRTYESLPASLAAGRTIFDHFLVHAGLGAAGAAPELFVLPEEMAALGLERDGGPELVVAYSADAVEPYRRWGEERFQALLRHLEQAHRVSVIELGSGVTAGHLGVGLDLVGATSLRQTMAVLSLADLFIGNHGGLTHLAGGVGTPVLSPWGASHPFAAYTYDALSVGVETAPECRYCHWTQQARAECVGADPLAGRTPCTQAIAVEAMIEAFEALAPRLERERQALAASKAERRARAKDPRSLARFDADAGFRGDALIQFYLGGQPAGWGPEHRRDDFGRLKKIVAFPDWDAPGSQWKGLLAEFATNFDPASPWVLVLGAHPLTGTEALARVREWAEREWRRPLPKVLLLVGTFSAAARRDLAASAELLLDEASTNAT